MFDLNLAWDRPARTGPSPTQHVLRIRISPQSAGQSLPLRMAIALDTSESMDGAKLKQAKEACRSVSRMLRTSDRLSLAGYSGSVTPLCDRLEGASAASACADAIGGLRAGGVTRVDRALEWIEGALPTEQSAARVGILITDGYPTDSRGAILRDTTSLVSQAARTATAGITLYTVGLGSAADFNTSFLTDLCDRGRGAFLFAQSPAELEPQLRSRFAASQSIAASDARLLFRSLMPGVDIIGCCRFRPEYCPIDAPASGAGTIRVGVLRSDVDTDVLLSVRVSPLAFGEAMGARDVLDIRLEASALNVPVSAVTAISHTLSYSEAQALNREVDKDRVMWDVNVYTDALNRTTDPNRTGQLLSQIQDAAQRAGQQEIANQAGQQLDDLRKTGKLNPNASTGLLSRSRNQGGRV